MSSFQRIIFLSQNYTFRCQSPHWERQSWKILESEVPFHCKCSIKTELHKWWYSDIVVAMLYSICGYVADWQSLSDQFSSFFKEWEVFLNFHWCKFTSLSLPNSFVGNYWVQRASKPFLPFHAKVNGQLLSGFSVAWWPQQSLAFDQHVCTPWV